MQDTLAQQLGAAARKYGTKDAFSFPEQNQKLNFVQLQAGADAVSKALLQWNLKKGSHVGIWSTNSARWVLLALGAAQIGVVIVPLNSCYRDTELKDICQRADLDALFLMNTIKGKSCEPIAELFYKDGKLNQDQFPCLKYVCAMGDMPCGKSNAWSEFIQNAQLVDDLKLQQAKEAVESEDIYSIQYTSGTTAKPKGARLRMCGVLNTARHYAKRMHLTPEDKICIPLPLFHCFGNVLTMLGGIVSGSSSIYLTMFSVSQMLSLLEQERCTCMMGVPTMYSAMLASKELDSEKICVQKAGIGGAFCPATLAERVQAGLGIEKVVVGYGLSETASLCSLSDLDDPKKMRIGSIGRALPELTIALADVQTDEIHTGSGFGEIVVKGMGVMVDYYHSPKETNQAIDADGWLHTGDLGQRDQDGVLYFKGRLKDIIVRGGENISAAEIEESVLKMDGVRACQCVGVQDELMGEEIAAFVIPEESCQLDDKGIQQAIKKELAHYKVPKYVFFVSGFPMNGSGKVLKSKLREWAEARIV